MKKARRMLMIAMSSAKRIEDGKSDAQEVEIGSNVERMAGIKMSRAKFMLR
jgi:hypothetical protein